MEESYKSFKILCNLETCLPSPAILDYFISGLKYDIQNELAILKPNTIDQVLRMAKLVESKLQAIQPPLSWPFPHRPSSNTLP